MSSVCIYNLYYLHQNSFDRHCDYHVVQPSFRMEAALTDIHRGVCSCSQFSLPTVRVPGIKFRLSGLVDCKCFYPTKPLHTHLLFERIALLVTTVPLVVWVHGASFLLRGLSSVDARSPAWWIRGLESLECFGGSFSFLPLQLVSTPLLACAAFLPSRIDHTIFLGLCSFFLSSFWENLAPNLLLLYLPFSFPFKPHFKTKPRASYSLNKPFFTYI